MNYAMEIHDSHLKDFAVNDDGTGFLLWHGYVYIFVGEFASSPYLSGWQKVRLSFTDMIVQGTVARGEYSVDGELQPLSRVGSGMIDLNPSELHDISLTFNLSPSFGDIHVRASKMVSSLEGPFEPGTIWQPDGSTKRFWPQTSR